MICMYYPVLYNIYQAKMSFEDHVSDMTQKYRLAVAISVIKSKPSDLSIEQYIEKLKSKYNKNTEMEDDFNISIHSDDFNMDEDEIVVLCHSFDETEPMAESQTILDGFVTDITKLNEQTEENNTSMYQIAQVLREIDENAYKETFDPLHESQYYEDSQLFDYPTTNIFTGSKGNLADCKQDKHSQKLDLTSKNKVNAALTNEKTSQEACFISKAKDSGNTALTTETTSMNTKKANIYSNTALNVIGSTVSTSMNSKQANISSNTALNVKGSTVSTSMNSKQANISSKMALNIIGSTVSTSMKSKQTNISSNTALNVIETSTGIEHDTSNNNTDQLETQAIEFTQNFTHISQSQFDYIHIPYKHLFGNQKATDNGQKVTDNGQKVTDSGQKVTEIHGIRSTQDFSNNFDSQREDSMLVDTDESSMFMGPEKPSMIMAPEKTSMLMGPEKQSMFMASEKPSMIMGLEKTSVLMGPEKQNMFMIQELQETSTQLQNKETAIKRKENTQIIKINSNMPLNIINPTQILYIIYKNGRKYRIVHEQEQNVCQNIQEYRNTSEVQEYRNTSEVQEHRNTSEVQEYRNTSEVQEYRNIISQKSQNTQQDRHIISQKSNRQKERNTISQNTQENEKLSQITQTNRNISQNTHEIFQNTQETQYEDNIDQELTNSQIEVVPFKVLDAFNKIKNFLNKADRKLSEHLSQSDSGYKTDSQKSVVNSSRKSANALNESAHCVYSYLLDCQLINSTEKITGELSQVLARHIDRLHDEEYYPPFLAAILESIDKMISDLTDGEHYGGHVLVKKDETIQRLCLLNKSVHIIEYTIDKITQKLEIIHTNLTNTDKMYETTDINICENTCYIFHILEILLKRYVKVKDVLTQESSNSQENEKLLKKSSITDIWRKKWIPNFKDNAISNVCMEKQCVLTKCSEVLNKIIVGCMEGYSLVSFSALQCFNVMQK